MKVLSYQYKKYYKILKKLFMHEINNKLWNTKDLLDENRYNIRIHG